MRIGDTDVGLFRVGDEVYAIANACPHAGVPLSEGFLEGHTIICSAHGWGFDVRTGLSTDGVSSMPIPCYRVQIEDGEVLIET